MFCSHCGKEISDKAAICIGCGAEVKAPAVEEKASAGWWWLGFAVPLAGLLIWVIDMDKYPKRAKKAGMGALISTIVGVALAILFYVLYFFLVIYVLAY